MGAFEMRKKNYSSVLDEKRRDTIAEILEDLRVKKGFSKRELANLFSVSYETICHYEKGITIPPTDLLLKYADLCNVTIDYILNRTTSQVDYSAIMEKRLSKDMTINDVVEIINKLTKDEKEHLAFIIQLLNKE